MQATEFEAPFNSRLKNLKGKGQGEMWHWTSVFVLDVFVCVRTDTACMYVCMHVYTLNIYVRTYAKSNPEIWTDRVTWDSKRRWQDCIKTKKAVLVLIALKMEAARTTETLVNFYPNTWRYNAEDSHLCTHRRKKLRCCYTKTNPKKYNCIPRAP
jgi:hypothetical protein